MPKSDTQFKKGQSGNPKGKPKGAVNAMTKDMKMVLEAALERLGEDAQKKDPTLQDLEPAVAWVVDVGSKNPQLVMPLLGKLLPAKLDIDVAIVNRDLVDLISQRRDQLAEMKDVTPTEKDAIDG